MIPLSHQEITLSEQRPNYFTNHQGWKWQLTLVDFDFWYCISGVTQIERDGQKFDAKPGYAFLFPPGERVTARFTHAAPVVNFAAHFTCTNQSLATLAQSTKSGVLLGDIDTIQSLASILITTQSQEGAASKAIAANTVLLLLQLFEEASGTKTQKAQHPLLNKTIREIRSRPWEDWTVDRIAREAGLSRAHLTRKMIESTGLAPKQLVIQSRSDMARILLMETPNTIEEIATNLGYRDIYFFSRQFKQATGLSPTQYRTANRTN